MKPIARLGDLHSCPEKGHGVTPIVSGSGSLDGGKPIACIGDKAGCGCTIIEGSSSTKIDGKPAAYLGAASSKSGKIITASGSMNIQP